MIEPGADEGAIVAALMGNAPPSRNQHYELLSSETGRRARRRASFLRSIGRDIERARREQGVITIDRGGYSRGRVRVCIHHAGMTRKAYLTEEEIALVPHTLQRLGAWFPSPGFCDEEMIFFRATDLRPPPADSPHRPDDDENIKARVCTIEEANRMAARGEIVDLKTAYGLTLI